MSTLKAGFDRYLKRLEILENNGSNPAKKTFKPLTTDDATKHIERLALENENLKNEILELKESYKSAIANHQLYLDDATLRTVTNTIGYLRSKFGESWESSFMSKYL
jgi:hypothetical protein